MVKSAPVKIGTDSSLYPDKISPPYMGFEPATLIAQDDH